MEITWSIKNLERRVSDGYVLKAFWTATATDNDLSTSISGCCIWPNGEIQTPYETLSEQQVLEWMWDSHVDKEGIEDSVKAEIEKKKSPVFIHGMPWAMEATEDAHLAAQAAEMNGGAE